VEYSTFTVGERYLAITLKENEKRITETNTRTRMDLVKIPENILLDIFSFPISIGRTTK